MGGNCLTSFDVAVRSHEGPAADAAEGDPANACSPADEHGDGRAHTQDGSPPPGFELQGGGSPRGPRSHADGPHDSPDAHGRGAAGGTAAEEAAWLRPPVRGVETPLGEVCSVRHEDTGPVQATRLEGFSDAKAELGAPAPHR